MMTTTSAKRFFVTLILVNCIFSTVPAQSENLDLRSEPLVVEEISPGGIAWQLLTAVESITLKVAGKEGVVYEHRFDPSGPFWYDLTKEDGALLKDGNYKYELRLARKLNPAVERFLWEAQEYGTEPPHQIPPVAFRFAGDFRVADGAVDTSEDGPDPDLDPDVPETGSRGAVPMDEIDADLYVKGGLCVGCEEATFGDVTYSDAVVRSGLCVGTSCPGSIVDGVIELRYNAPYIRLDGTTGDWYVRNGGGKFQLSNIGSPFSSIDFTVEAGTTHAAFYLDSDGYLGLGTSMPETDLHVIGKGTSGDPTIRLEATGTPAEEYEWELAGAEWGFFVKDVPANRTAFAIEAGAPTASLRISPAGDIGLGTKTPTGTLHVKRSNGRSKVLVEETSALTAVRTQFQLKNNGAPRFALENTSSGIEWSFQQSSPGNFLISMEGTGGPEMQVYQNGRVRMGPAGAINFDLTPSGDLTIAGSLTANGSVFPDYVFEPDYELMPLSELSAFIVEEKRLPKIPSAEEIQKKGGHNMTELQLQLLEKIEELTLYTLEQDRRLEDKEAELERLQASKVKQDERIGLLETQMEELRALLTNR